MGTFYTMSRKNAFYDVYIVYISLSGPSMISTVNNPSWKGEDNTVLRFLKNPEKIIINPGIPEKPEKYRDSGINPGRWQRCP